MDCMLQPGIQLCLYTAESCQSLARYNNMKSHFHLNVITCRDLHFHIILYNWKATIRETCFKYFYSKFLLVYSNYHKQCLAVKHPHGAFIAVPSVPITRLTNSPDIRLNKICQPNIWLLVWTPSTLIAWHFMQSYRRGHF